MGEMTRDERGSVTIVLVALLGIVLLVAMGLADVTSTIAAATRAQDAADATALGAAQEMAMPSGRSPTEVATEYAVRNGSSLVACICDPASFEAVVTVRVPVGRLLLFDDARTVEASARAVVALPSS
jgi:secretion/DNA translocation related TadE-like protein